jgi:fructokinase
VRSAAVEVGGTKVLCLVGSDPDHIVAQTRIPTGKPAETLAQVLAFFQQEVSSGGPLAAIGIASFGPLELRRSHPQYGFIRTSPKPGWSEVDLVGPARRALGVPVGFDTDVNAAALGEGRWGAARGLDTFVYLTVGTGIGVGAVVEGRVIHGLGHPEMGHLSVPHQPGDHFAGHCPFHGDCWEGMGENAAKSTRGGRKRLAVPPSAECIAALPLFSPVPVAITISFQPCAYPPGACSSAPVMNDRRPRHPPAARLRSGRPQPPCDRSS